jgi:hypothetical protein
MSSIKNLIKRMLGKTNLQYSVDVVTADMISGWACNTINPKEPCLVQIKDGDKVLATTKAATLREDLVAAGVGNGCHGFTLQLAMLPFTSATREVNLFINGKRVSAEPIALKSSFTDILGDFAAEVEKRMDALLAIQNERMQREFDTIKQMLNK